MGDIHTQLRHIEIFGPTCAVGMMEQVVWQKSDAIKFGAVPALGPQAEVNRSTFATDRAKS